MNQPFRPVLVVPALFLFFACAEDRTAGLVSSDSAGIRILEIPAAFPISHVDLGGETVSIVTGRDDDPIGAVRGLIWVDSARIVLADNDMTVRVYDRSGRRLAMAGKRGEGPGEFEDILWLDHGENGGFAAFDPRLNRLTVFDSTLAFHRAVNPTANPGLLPHWAGFLPGEVGLAGVGMVNEPGPGRIRPPDRWGYTPVFVYSGDGNEIETIARFAWNRCKDDVSTRCVPDGWGGTLNPEGERIYLTPLDWPEILEYSASGDLLSIIRHLDPAGEGFPQLIVDDRRRVWTSRESEAFWTVYDPSVPTLLRYTFPERFRLMDVWGSSALGVLRDSLNVSYVAVVDLGLEVGS
ncbi:MAG: hypothetical protein PVJ76_07785 [Gemmatimonadota bacterium]|jgi:hypothetical protein